MNTSYKGKNLQCLLGGKSIGLATSHQLSLSANTADTSTKDSDGTFVENEVTTITWTIQSDNLCSHGTDGTDTEALVDAFLTGAKVTVLFGLVDPVDAAVTTGGFVVNTTATDRFAYQGSAIITSLNITANNGERATSSVTFTGSGKLTKVQPASQQNGD